MWDGLYRCTSASMSWYIKWQLRGRCGRQKHLRLYNMYVDAIIKAMHQRGMRETQFNQFKTLNINENIHFNMINKKCCTTKKLWHWFYYVVSFQYFCRICNDFIIYIYIEHDFCQCSCFSGPRDGGIKEDTHMCGTARVFKLCPAYIKHALLLQLEQKGKQCHQVKFLRIPQSP